MGSPAAIPASDVKALRAFNRFYTQRIGVLRRYLDSDFTLTEVRVLYELAHRNALSASALGRELGLDPGYLSRILRRFEQQGWIEKEPSPDDARKSLLHITPTGRAAFEPLQQRSREEAAELLAATSAAERQQLLSAMATVQRVLDPHKPGPRVELRAIQPGDMGWIVQQHGEIYAREYGFTMAFEALVADIAAHFIRSFDPAKECGWIAEVDGERMGSALVVRQSSAVAKLRLLIVKPEARGLGLGGRLTDECIAFARSNGYRRMTLWTHAHLHAARAIYRSRGFECIQSEPLDADYCAGLTSETWELRL